MIPSKPIILHADPEHAGIRMAVIPALIFCVWLGYKIAGAIIAQMATADQWLILSCISGLALGLGMAWLFEWGLKRVWKSGKTVEIKHDVIVIKQKGDVAAMLRMDAPVTNLKWYFGLKGYPRAGRERRIDGKWLCLACQLMQGEQRLIVYGFLPPDDGQALIQSGDFFQIDPTEVYEKSFRTRMGAASNRPKLSTRVLTGRAGRYWSAEQRRWGSGWELTAEDFQTLLASLPAEISG